MVRTQIYLSKQERVGLSNVSKATGRKQSDLIREAVDMFLGFTQGDRREAVLKEAAGLWKNRNDLPDFTTARKSWDRG